ncbi:MAG TPA: glycosyltransferase family 2 protein [Lacibacter sp.]|nr:glycosyltransferase family 2 protein [Lacibacter sp.]
MNYKRVSIVTPTFNQGDFIEETIESVLSQNYPDLEYFIVDGGSTDQTVSIIKKYEKYLTGWISERDRGQAHAINKGLVRCTGEIFNWLNSDDYLEPGSLNEIARLFNEDGVHLVAGKVRLIGGDSDQLIDENKLLSAEGLMLWKPGVKFIQPGVWMRRTLLENCGGIDEKYHYCFDKDMLLRYLYYYPHVAYSDNVLVNFRFHEASKTVSFRSRFSEETREIIRSVSNDSRLPGLHKGAKWRTRQGDWLRFLRATAAQKDESKLKRILKILACIHMQPMDSGGFRMTAGGIRRILQGETIPE